MSRKYPLLIYKKAFFWYHVQNSLTIIYIFLLKGDFFMNYKQQRRKERREARDRFAKSAFRLIVVILIPVYVIMLLMDYNRSHSVEDQEPVPETVQNETTEEEPIAVDPNESTEPGELWTTGTFLTFEELTEDNVYTFLQGPKAWSSKAPYSGAWCDEVLAGQKFSVFGCGLCDLANIYSTLTPYTCSPVDMFYFARDETGYAPSSAAGAIAWDYMQDALWKTGIYSQLHDKDATYEEFQQQIASGITAICNVNSGNDSTYWQGVTGHYINIWLYDPATDTVFLGDSGNPDHNRQRIPLKYVYDALKTADSHQYLLVTAVNLEANTWEHDGIEGEWTAPG